MFSPANLVQKVKTAVEAAVRRRRIEIAGLAIGALLMAGAAYRLGALSDGSAESMSTWGGITALGEPTVFVVVGCDRHEEAVTIRNVSREAQNLERWRVDDQDSSHVHLFESERLVKPGHAVRLVSGDAEAVRTNEVQHKSGRQNVWNKSGDTVYLTGPGPSSSFLCGN